MFLVLAALLLVANTIRLAAFARRKEIGIMRLVGASTLYIALPFLLEALVTAVIGVGTGGRRPGGVHVLRAWSSSSRSMVGFMPWVGWPEYLIAVLVVARPRSAAHPAADTRADPEIPQSVSRAGYLRGVHFPEMPKADPVRFFPRTARRRWAAAVAACAVAAGALTVPLANAEDLKHKQRNGPPEGRARPRRPRGAPAPGHDAPWPASTRRAPSWTAPATSLIQVRARLDAARVRDEQMQLKLEAAVARLERAEADLADGRTR